MKQHPTSRRSFLGSMAILSAGAAFGSAAKPFALTDSTADLQGQWNSFCKQHNGHRANAAITLSSNPVPVAAGHLAKEGEIISFAEEGLLAQPTWIYWSPGNPRPADVVITFCQNNEAKTKLFRLNRFELEALLALPEEQNSLALVKQAAQSRFSRKKNGFLCITAKVREHQRVHIQTRLAEKEINVQQKLIYHI